MIELFGHYLLLVEVIAVDGQIDCLIDPLFENTHFNVHISGSYLINYSLTTDPFLLNFIHFLPMADPGLIPKPTESIIFYI